MDELDRALLRLLQQNGRRTNRDLALATHVVPSTSLQRVRSLVERGIISGFRAEVDLVAIGRPVQALISVRVRPPSRAVIEDFRTWASGLTETVSLFSTTGAFDFLLHVAVPTVDGLYGLVTDRLAARPEVSDVRTSLVFDHRRSAAIEPAPPSPE
ncbi:putative transcriptional regulator of the AsnC-family [Frankia canadensis]|uniref:Putative transcriptional regulator of the AsnC-family n=1 Tax=Frankia canadensis TaxID=1836972 RepID=A0A2I2KUX0_9ACTN|nr:Lrp/AsnC family transcriptional regulator [Frankia canadensis]SNQ49456.1 putative transcriptional regulator of the AsnC-family [Frankia canadensis]SOU56746.1 putative transcriptional regulator of the AsnC-family [Frankia canadensis]